MNARSTPPWILTGYSSNQPSKFGVDARSSRFPPTGLPTPEQYTGVGNRTILRRIRRQQDIMLWCFGDRVFTFPLCGFFKFSNSLVEFYQARLCRHNVFATHSVARHQFFSRLT